MAFKLITFKTYSIFAIPCQYERKRVSLFPFTREIHRLPVTLLRLRPVVRRWISDGGGRESVLCCFTEEVFEDINMIFVRI